MRVEARMARGWESKAVEEQQLERDRGRSRTLPAEHDPAALARRQGLELARARATDDLARARTPSHRAMLEAALADLDAQLRSLAPQDRDGR
jgi:hypothetical protein